MRQEKEVILPDWLEPDVWFDYVDLRKILKKPLTRRAKELAIMRLDKLRQYEDPRFIVDRSINGGWQKLYPPKTEETNVTRKADNKGLSARPGESWEQFNQRIQRTR